MNRRNFLNRIGLGIVGALIAPKILESDRGEDFIWIDESNAICQISHFPSSFVCPDDCEGCKAFCSKNLERVMEKLYGKNYKELG